MTFPTWINFKCFGVDLSLTVFFLKIPLGQNIPEAIFF